MIACFIVSVAFVYIIKKLSSIMAEPSLTYFSGLDYSDYSEIREWIYHTIFDCRLADPDVRYSLSKLLRHIECDSNYTIYSRLSDIEHGKVVNEIIDDLLTKGGKQFSHMTGYQLISIGRNAICNVYLCEPHTCKYNHWIKISKEDVNSDVIKKYERSKTINGERWFRKITK